MPDDEIQTHSPRADAAHPAAGEAVGRANNSTAPSNEELGQRKCWLPLAVAVAAPLLVFFFLPPLTKSGLWDPYELNVADLSRRVALNLYHAASLALEGADNSLPHLNDLGRPQLPFSSIALGFKLFGLHEWAGRLPLAVWGLSGVLATYAFVARLFDKRTGMYAAVVLATTPLYFVQARTMLGDICAMASLAMSFGGLAVVVFDARAPRLRWLLMAAAGLAAGLESRGALLGLAVPLLGVGLAWGAARLSAARESSNRVGDVLGALSLALGAAIAGIAANVIAGADSRDMSLWVGAMLHYPPKYPTFDFYVGSIGHALAPWSALLPFAFGRLLLTPAGTSDAYVAERESLGRVAVLVGSAVALVAHGYLATRTDLIAFEGPVLCAVACAVAIRDFERGAHASIALGIGTLLLAAVLHHDFHELPEKAYQAFGIAGAAFPESFKAAALTRWWIVLGGFALCAFLTWAERDAPRAPFDPANYSKVLRSLREAYDGLLAVLYLAVLAGAAFAGVLVWLGVTMRWRWVAHDMSSTLRECLVNLWWLVGLLLVAVFAALFACDVWLWAFGRSRPLGKASLTRGFEPIEELIARLRPEAGQSSLCRHDWWVALVIVAPLMLLTVPAIAFVAWHALGFKPSVAALLAAPSGVVFFLVMGVIGDSLRHRAPGLAFGGAVTGLVLCVSYYPALANQLSPKEVFESYRQVCPGAPLALLGVGGRTAAYYAGGQPRALTDPTAAYRWLVAGGAERRCLALKSEELPSLNRLWREGSNPRTNLPVLDARSSQILLASSSLARGARNENPLSSMVLDAAPRPQRRIDANLDDKLEVLGIDLDDQWGRRVDAIAPGRTYHLKTYYRVLAPVPTEWQAFIHIDGLHRRHNGDHRVMNGKYPMSLWLPGDLVVDDHEFKLEPNFTPGTYTIYFGLFVGDTRLKVNSGPNDGDNRVNGGPLRVQ